MRNFGRVTIISANNVDLLIGTSLSKALLAGDLKVRGTKLSEVAIIIDCFMIMYRRIVTQGYIIYCR